MTETPTALVGFSIPAMEALDKAGMPFTAVVPEEFQDYMEKYEIPYVPWQFGKFNEQSHSLVDLLRERGVQTAVPLYEETVEWAGFVNAELRDDPRLMNRAMLFRDKALMKRRAQMSGIRVGVFEEVERHDEVRKFFKRLNEAMLKLPSEALDLVHLKPLAAAGSQGHRVIRTESEIDDIREDEFPCLIESHLDGQEFSCEVFIHGGKIQFLNITEYIRLGYTNFVPASPSLQEKRPQIRAAIEQLIDAFGVEYGMIHPEYFVDKQGNLSFGEVAARVPGGHIFELIEAAYGFSPFTAFALCSNPQTTQEQLDAFFPGEGDHKTYAGCLMVYPRQEVVTDVDMPEALLEDPYYERHNLFVPATAKVAERSAFGDHYGTIYLKGDDPDRLRSLLSEYTEYDFYTGHEPERKTG